MEKDVKGKVNAFKYGEIMDCQTLGWERQSNSLRCGERFRSRARSAGSQVLSRRKRRMKRLFYGSMVLSAIIYVSPVDLFDIPNPAPVAVQNPSGRQKGPAPEENSSLVTHWRPGLAPLGGKASRRRRHSRTVPRSVPS
jgi:hypothetical protein